ncbi:MAG: hypothetical protein CMB66_02675 [Euryarchaeota archaeon]|nr:hypothetical protein [Euryarchaeota archaeon]
MVEDVGVETKSNCLAGKKVILCVSGGIAATEAIKLSRELRRHGAIVYPMMTKSAEKVITPLALSWGSGMEVISEWESKMSQLGSFDALILAPATRNTIAKFAHGILDSPVMMAISAASGRGNPIMFVPSMHDDLFGDPVTKELLDSVNNMGISIFLDDSREGRRKQPDSISIVGNFCNIVNSKLPNRKKVAVTLGANSSPIDSVRFIQNYSTGTTGWAIAEHFHRMGHEVVCVSGKTSEKPSFSLPDVRVDSTPEGMLGICLQLANSENAPESWVHAAAILDYVPEFVKGKRPSGKSEWEVKLRPTKKHIREISEFASGSKRIAFKLEVEDDENSLVLRSKELIDNLGIDAVVANLLSEAKGDLENRCRIVFPDGKVKQICNLRDLSESLEALISAD